MDQEGILVNDSISVGTSTVVVSSPALTGPEREELYLTNTSTGGQIITLSFDQEAVPGKGIVLYPTGTYGGSNGAGFRLSNKQINAISSGAGGVLSRMERRGNI